MAQKKYKQMKTIRVSDDVRELVDNAHRVVATLTKGEVIGINNSLEYALTKFIEENIHVIK